MNNPKAQFQINNGSEWETIAEADIIDGVVEPPNAWTMARAMHKRILYVGYTPVKTTVAPSDERTTHFSGYAKAVRQEEQNKMCGIGLNDWTPTKSEKVGRDVVARRAYDLVLHVLGHTTPASGNSIKQYQGLTIEEIAAMIPDMPALPVIGRDKSRLDEITHIADDAGLYD